MFLIFWNLIIVRTDRIRKLRIMLGAKAGWGDIKCHGEKIVILDWVTRKDFTEMVT